LRGGDPELLRGGHCRLLGARGGQSAQHRSLDEPVHGAGLAKAHLGLARMNVDIDQARVERQPQHVRGLPVVMEHVAIRLAQRVASTRSARSGR
jgi:hypothetical protein